MKISLIGVGVFVFAQLCGAGMAKARDIDWIAMNPAYEGATFARDPKACIECHDDVQFTYNHTIHAKAFKVNIPENGECGACHGPRSKHIKDEKEIYLTSVQKSEPCLQCHQGGDRKHWASGPHASANVICVNCHEIMKNKSEEGLLSAQREEDVCYPCHAEVRGEMNKPSHHPVREGKLSCTACHNPHGSGNPSMLKGVSVNDTCFGCHQEKRGPFVWEHAPVRESCLNCHDAHGSNNRKLLNSKDSFLCLQCHTYGGHINLPRYNRTSNPYGEGCVNCHITIHGSNSPSGVKFTR